MQNKIAHLERWITILRQSNNEILSRQARLTELRDFLDQVNLFMLRLMQGLVDFQILLETLGHKINERELRTLYDATRNQPQHLRRRALTVIYHLYGIGNTIIMPFLHISRNTVKRYVRKFEELGVDQLLDASKRTPKVADGADIKELILSLLHSPPKEFNYNRTSWTLTSRSIIEKT